MGAMPTPLRPDQAEGVFNTIGVDRWSRNVTPPLRLIAGAGQGPDGACLGLREAVRLRVMRPQLGEDTLWVARTFGEADPSAVEAVVAHLIQGG
eukprot:6579057-Lingulodinium_polyedra.AAC.1